jgi:ferredoxin-NADP reductase
VVLTRPIKEVRPATPRARVVRIDLQGADFPYLAGQAVLVGDAGHDRRRPYSIADAPEIAARDGCLELLVGLDADGTAGPHLTLASGAEVDIEGPFGRFTFPTATDERRFLFIAGGTGIAPLRAMLRHALRVPHDAIGVLFSARTASEFAYQEELRALAERRAIDLQLRVTRDSVPDSWTGTTGRFGSADLASLVHDRATLCFVCGPPALVEEIAKALEVLGVPRRCIRTEEFTNSN